MLHVSTFAVRALVVSASAALHVAVFSSGGHGSAPSSSGTNAAAVELTIEAPQVVDLDVEIAAPPPNDDHDDATTAAPGHTHDYPVSPSHDTHPHDPSIVHAIAPVAAPPSHDEPATEPVVTAPNAPSTSEATPPASTPPSFKIELHPKSARSGAVASSISSKNSGAAGAAGGVATGGGGGSGSGTGSGAGDGPLPESKVSAKAKLVSRVDPVYPAEARAQEIEADVPLDIVVDATGVVTSAKVAKNAGFGFDDAALKAIRSYRFSPAQLDGHPVAVRMRWPVSFRLR